MMTALGTVPGGCGQSARWWSQWLQYWQEWQQVTEL